MIKTFSYHKPSEDGMEKIRKLREAYSTLHEMINSICPSSRERATALTYLETSGMWGIKAVVFNDPNSEVES